MVGNICIAHFTCILNWIKEMCSQSFIRIQTNFNENLVWKFKPFNVCISRCMRCTHKRTETLFDALLMLSLIHHNFLESIYTIEQWTSSSNEHTKLHRTFINQQWSFVSVRISLSSHDERIIHTTRNSLAFADVFFVPRFSQSDIVEYKRGCINYWTRYGGLVAFASILLILCRFKIITMSIFKSVVTEQWVCAHRLLDFMVLCQSDRWPYRNRTGKYRDRNPSESEKYSKVLITFIFRVIPNCSVLCLVWFRLVYFIISMKKDFIIIERISDSIGELKKNYVKNQTSINHVFV